MLSLNSGLVLLLLLRGDSIPAGTQLLVTPVSVAHQAAVVAPPAVIAAPHHPAAVAVTILPVPRTTAVVTVTTVMEDVRVVLKTGSRLS